jgi:hypothetical protein
MLQPEQVVERLRDLWAQIPDVTPLTPRQKRVMRKQAELSEAVLHASINVIGASDAIAQVVGQPAEDVRQLVEETNRWTAVESDLRRMLNGVEGGNLIRRQRAALIAKQASNIASQLARSPANADLVPHVQEIQRLKKIARRKKTQPAPQPLTPAPETPTSGVSPEPDAFTTGKP